MKTVIIIKAGSTFPTTRQCLGDFEDWIIRSIEGFDVLISVVNVLEGETLPPVDTLSGIIITGSHGMVTVLFPSIEGTDTGKPEVIVEKSRILCGSIP